MDTTPERATAERVFERLRTFIGLLDDDERAMFAALIAPGVAQAYRDDEVVAFAAPGEADEVVWSPSALPDALREAIRDHDVRVVGLNP